MRYTCVGDELSVVREKDRDTSTGDRFHCGSARIKYNLNLQSGFVYATGHIDVRRARPRWMRMVVPSMRWGHCSGYGQEQVLQISWVTSVPEYLPRILQVWHVAC